MKSTRRGAMTRQLNAARAQRTDDRAGGLEDPSQSGIRAAVNLPVNSASDRAPSSAKRNPADVTVVFRGVLPMERLVQLIRRRAHETAPKSSLVVEVEQVPQVIHPSRWCVRVRSDSGEFSASEAGPFLAVTRAFALLA